MLDPRERSVLADTLAMLNELRDAIWYGAFLEQRRDLLAEMERLLRADDDGVVHDLLPPCGSEAGRLWCSHHRVALTNEEYQQHVWCGGTGWQCDEHGIEFLVWIA